MSLQMLGATCSCIIRQTMDGFPMAGCRDPVQGDRFLLSDPLSIIHIFLTRKQLYS